MFGSACIPPTELVSTIDPPRPPAIRCGTAARAVCHRPVRLMSMVSFQLPAAIDSTGPPMLAIPALATTMSSRPSSATPSSTAALTASKSRTSAWVAMMRRSCASTSLTVSARSSGVAIGSALDIVADVDGDDVGPLLGQPHRVAAALAASGAGDESDLAFSSSWHDLPRFLGLLGFLSCRQNAVGRRPHGRQNALVARAAAQVPGQGVADLLVGRIGMLPQERGRRDDEAGGAEAALQRVVLAEGGLHGRELARSRRRAARVDALDRGDLAAVRLHGEDQAGADGLAAGQARPALVRVVGVLQQDRAGAADAVLAADVGASQLAALAQEVDQGQPRLHARAPEPAVDPDPDADLSHRPPPRRASRCARVRPLRPSPR